EVHPRRRIVVLADAEKAAVAQDRIGDLAAHLVEHHALDLADLLVIGAVDRGALDLVAADQRGGLAGFESRCCHGGNSFGLSGWGVDASCVAVERVSIGPCRMFRCDAGSISDLRATRGMTVRSRTERSRCAPRGQEKTPAAVQPGS